MWKRVGVGIAVAVPIYSVVEALPVDPGIGGLWWWGLVCYGACGCWVIVLGGSPSWEESE